MEYMKRGFLKGVAFGAGFCVTSLFAAATAMNFFTSGDVLSAAKINQNFAIAAPEGTVASFYLANCPDGWAPADGTNGTPDLRGVFIRGRDDFGTGAAGNDPAGVRPLGNLQSDGFQGHRHSVTYTDTTVIIPPTGGGFTFGPGPWGLGSFSVAVADPASDGTNGTPRTANETRPKNVSLIFCMRANR